jgi:hypothetical protein
MKNQGWFAKNGSHLFISGRFFLTFFPFHRMIKNLVF